MKSKVKLKISDEELDALAESYSFTTGYVGFRNGYITASAEYQSKVDKLFEVIEEMRQVIKDCEYIFAVSVADESVSEKELNLRHDALERFCKFDLKSIDKKPREL